jgi:hypothetical protein
MLKYKITIGELMYSAIFLVMVCIVSAMLSSHELIDIDKLLTGAIFGITVSLLLPINIIVIRKLFTKHKG